MLCEWYAVFFAQNKQLVLVLMCSEKPFMRHVGSRSNVFKIDNVPFPRYD